MLKRWLEEDGDGEKLDVTTAKSKSLQTCFASGVSETEKGKIESIEEKKEVFPSGNFFFFFFLAQKKTSITSELFHG